MSALGSVSSSHHGSGSSNVGSGANPSDLLAKRLPRSNQDFDGVMRVAAGVAEVDELAAGRPPSEDRAGQLARRRNRPSRFDIEV